MIIYNRTQYKTLTNEQYQEEKRVLQIELLKLQEWIINSHKSVAILNNSNNYLIIIRFVIFLLPTVIVIKYVPCSTLFKSIA